MLTFKPRLAPRSRRLGLLIAGAVLASASAASAACRVTDFTDRSLSSLNEIERLSFTSQMTQTEFDKLKAAAPGSENYYALIAGSTNVVDARQKASEKIRSLKIENSAEYAKIWASDFLNDDQLKKFISCTSQRRPGLVLAGRPNGPDQFNLAFAHLTPIGIEKITLKLVASKNIANAGELDAFLTQLGERDNYTAEVFPLRLADPKQSAVVVLRAGWETPNLIYIPAYPAPDVR